MSPTLLENQGESQPLLGGEAHHGGDDDQQLPDIDDEPLFTSDLFDKPQHGLLSRFQARKPTTIILLLSLMMFAIITSGMMIMVPVFRLMEDALCHVYYNKDPSEQIEERLCKVDGVQSGLAYLGGWGAMLSSVIGMLAALPYGVLADRIGRRKVFALSYFGIVLSFGYGPLLLWFAKAPNLWLILIGCLFLLIGGGIPVAINSLNAMAVDVSPDGDKSTGLLYLSAGAVSGALIGPVISGLLMTINPWIPILVVFVITPFIFGLIMLIPETLPLMIKSPSEEVDSSPFTMIVENIKEGIQELTVAFGLLKDVNLILTMVNFFIQPALFAAYVSTLAQYISKYFGWTLAQTSYRLSPPLGLLHLLILVVLPHISTNLTATSGRFRLSAFSKDLLLTKISLLSLILGALIEGISQSVALFILGLTVGTFGAANGPLCKAVATTYVEPDHTSRLYALISMLETSGALIGGPVLAWCFNIGMSKGGLWKGLPWFYVALLVSLALAALLLVKAPKQKGAPPADEGSRDLVSRSVDGV